MSHWSKDAIVERAEQDALEMSDKKLIDIVITKELADAQLHLINIMKKLSKITRGEISRDELIDQAIDILVEEFMNTRNNLER